MLRRAPRGAISPQLASLLLATVGRVERRTSRGGREVRALAVAAVSCVPVAATATHADR